MAYWLFKSEPEAWSWDDQVKKGAAGEEWTGVRNHTAKQNMVAMKKGDLGFFYHSVEEKSVVGIVRVIAEAHPDSKDTTGIWRCVDVEAVMPMPKPVSLVAIKAEPRLADSALVEVFAAFRAARDRGGVATDLRDGRHEEGPDRAEIFCRKAGCGGEKTRAREGAGKSDQEEDQVVPRMAELSDRLPAARPMIRHITRGTPWPIIAFYAAPCSLRGSVALRQHWPMTRR